MSFEWGGELNSDKATLDQCKQLIDSRRYLEAQAILDVLRQNVVQRQSDAKGALEQSRHAWRLHEKACNSKAFLGWYVATAIFTAVGLAPVGFITGALALWFTFGRGRELAIEGDHLRARIGRLMDEIEDLEKTSDALSDLRSELHAQAKHEEAASKKAIAEAQARVAAEARAKAEAEAKERALAAKPTNQATHPPSKIAVSITRNSPQTTGKSLPQLNTENTRPVPWK